MIYEQIYTNISKYMIKNKELRCISWQTNKGGRERPDPKE